MNISDYTILTTKTITEMVKKMKTYIGNGWEPLGGVQISVENEETVYVQTVIHKD